MTIDPSLPGDDDIVSQHPPQARAMRTALRNEHDANGRHIQVSFTNRAGSPPAGLADHVTMWQEDGVLFQRVGTGAATPLGVTPVGGIIMWSGLLIDIPAGWALCDGTNGTPDLRDKFIKGSADTVDPGVTGGALTHNHGGATANHTLTAAQSGMPAHLHGIPTVDANASGSSNGFLFGVRAGAATQFTAINGPLNASQGHSHNIGAVNHEPPFFALAFIMFTG